MSIAEQKEFISSMLNEQLKNVREKIKTRSEALNFVVGYLLSAFKLGFLTDDEETKAYNDFKIKLNEIKKQKEGKENEL